jgi:hypothetical protein
MPIVPSVSWAASVIREVISGTDILHLLGRRRRTGSWSLDDHQRVAFGVAEPEQRRDGVAEVLQLRVVGVDVVGLERDAGWRAC